MPLLPPRSFLGISYTILVWAIAELLFPAVGSDITHCTLSVRSSFCLTRPDLCLKSKGIKVYINVAFCLQIPYNKCKSLYDIDLKRAEI